MRAVQMMQHGNPEVLQVVELPIPTPRADYVLVKNEAIGVNYVDIQHRQGGYYPVQLPLIPGIEAAGVVMAIGDQVRWFQTGDRVAYAGYMGGNYAEYTLVPEAQLVKIPAGLATDVVAAGLLQGMTAQCLTQDVYTVRPEDWVLVHAAAGGVGSLLVQLAKQQGARVIATVSSETKAQFAQKLGADHVILYQSQDFAAETLRLTADEGVHVVYDALGQATFDQSLASLRRCGYMVVYGQTTGAIPPFDINRLSGITAGSSKGSLFLTWAALSHYNVTREDLVGRANAVFELLIAQRLEIPIYQRLPLDQASEAHRLMERRGVIGKVLLIP